MLKILSLDPSGTGTTGLCLIKDHRLSFQEFHSKDWTQHLTCLTTLIKTWQPTLLLYENTHYIHHKNQDSLDLFRLLGAIESLPIKKASLLANQVKDLKKQLFQGNKLTFKPGRGWLFKDQRISLHQLDAFLVYWIWKEKGDQNA